MFLFLILIVATLLFCFNSKYKVKQDNFTDFSCDAIQNKYYQPEELLYKSRCPNLVIVEKHINGIPQFFAELGDYKGPYFSKDYTTFYYLGVSPEGIQLNLDYDLYYYPFYNPVRWFNGPFRYHRRWSGNWNDNWFNPWNKYKNRINRRKNYNYRDSPRRRKNNKDYKKGRYGGKGESRNVDVSKRGSISSSGGSGSSARID